MQVSFGAVYSTKEPDMYMTRKQYAVDQAIEKTFYSTGWTNGYKYDSRTPLEFFISDRTGSDVVIKHRKDGNVEVKLFNEFNREISNGDYDCECDEDKKPLRIVLDLKKSLPAIKRAIDKFAGKCCYFAECGYEARKYKEEEEALEADDEQFQEQMAALDALREEEEFIEEFGTEIYN